MHIWLTSTKQPKIDHLLKVSPLLPFSMKYRGDWISHCFACENVSFHHQLVLVSLCSMTPVFQKLSELDMIRLLSHVFNVTECQMCTLTDWPACKTKWDSSQVEFGPHHPRGPPATRSQHDQPGQVKRLSCSSPSITVTRASSLFLLHPHSVLLSRLLSATPGS